jgi:tetratricopeptide (TPR) repeat protein
MSARIICKAVKTLAVAALGLAGYCSIRLAFADWLFRANTSASVARAAAIDSGDAAYHAWLAEIQEYEGLDPARELEIASRLNPSDSAVWIRRALLAESHRDFARAEALLLEAVRIDKLYAPRWALANYYARTGDTGRFLASARQALEMGYGDLSPLFRLCWSVTGDAALIRSRAIPPRRDVWGKYLAFLTQDGRLEAAEPIAQSFLAQARAPDTPILLNYCDRLIDRKLVSSAVSVWNALCRRGLLPLSPLDPGSGLALTNGGFQSEPLQQGFDWRTSAPPEISVTRAESPPALRFHLSGKQPEHCELLSQFVPLAPGKQYSFRFEHRAPVASGLRWRIGDLARSAELAGEEWKSQEVTFASGSSSLTRLALVYDRASGSVRTEGELWIRNATIALAR